MACSVFQILLLLVLASSVHCKRYDLAAGWKFSTANRLKQFQAAENAGSYVLLNAMAEDDLILSDKGTFGLSFFSFNGTNDYYLSVIMATTHLTNAPASGAVVWTANRQNPVPGNATLGIIDNGTTLALVDSENRRVWSTPRNGSISGIELQESGNFFIYNANNDTVWQSFDEPCDVILEGQSIFTGQKMVSSSNSSTMTTGSFEVSVENSGIGLFFQLPAKTREPYFLWPLWNQGNAPTDVSSIGVDCPTYETVLRYNSSTISMTYQKKRFGSVSGNGNGACGPDLTVRVSATNERLSYIKLDPSGNLVQMAYNASSSAWITTTTNFVSLIGSCLPLSCSADSICGQSGQCECLKSAPGASKCSAPSDLPLVCNELEAENHHFLSVSGAKYFSNSYTKPDRISTLEDCQSVCLSNCSCQALFYNNVSRSCFFVQEVHGGLTADASTSAFLKLQNAKLVRPTKSNVRKIVLGLAGGTIALMALTGIAAIWLWKRREEQIKKTLAAALRGALHRYTYKELKQATGKFSSVLGAGGSGSVYEGVLGDGRRVAIKQLENSNQGEKEFIAEVNTIGSISHVNIVKLCGYCASGPHRMLVYEHVANGSLDKWLFSEGNEGVLLDWKTRFEIALGTARGLAYLHEESRLLIMHLDVKPQNVLLDEQFVAKVSDFGMAKVLLNRETSQATTTIRGTPGYLAPEWLLNSVATTKCDVYSYGMVLLEIISGRKNLGNRKTSLASSQDEEEEELPWYFPAWAVDRVREGRSLEILDRMIVGNLDEQMETEVTRLLRVALWCIQGNPAARPSMDTVVQMLEGVEDVSEPPLAFHFAIQSPGIISISTGASGSTSLSSSTISLSSLQSKSSLHQITR